MDEQLLIRFLTHTCTPEDLRSIDQWIASGKPNADWLFEMERIWSLKDELRFSDRREIEEAYNRFTLSLGKSKNAKPHFYIYPILKYVAAVIIIGLLGLNLYKMVQPATVGENTVEVPKGQRASLMLSDGTKIWLNSQSKLIYPTQFSDKERNVRLEGEAFFDVAHKEHLPFVVHSPLLAIKVLGTKFNVKAYFDEKSVVTLAEGKVEVETNDCKNRLTLKPNEQVSIGGAGMPDGPSILGSVKDGQPVIVEDGVAKLLDRTAFAGSVATADRLVRTMIQVAEVPLTDAVRMMTETPARIIGIDHKKGAISVGMDADLVLFDDNINICMTIVEGNIVYNVL